jgi:hypothetical protein
MLFAILPPLARELQVAEVYRRRDLYGVRAAVSDHEPGLGRLVRPIWPPSADRVRPVRLRLVLPGVRRGAWAGQVGLLPPLAAIFAMALARSCLAGWARRRTPPPRPMWRTALNPLNAPRPGEPDGRVWAGHGDRPGAGGVFLPADRHFHLHDRWWPVWWLVAALAVRLFLPEQHPAKKDGPADQSAGPVPFAAIRA